MTVLQMEPSLLISAGAFLLSAISIALSILTYRRNGKMRIDDKYLELRQKVLEVKRKIDKIHILTKKFKINENDSIWENMKRTEASISTFHNLLKGNLSHDITEKLLDDALIRAMEIEASIDGESERLEDIIAQFSRK